MGFILAEAGISEAMLHQGIYLICGFYVVARAGVRFFMFKAIHERPRFLRFDEVLLFIDLVTIIALIGSFFVFLLLGWEVWKICLIVGGLILYDLAIRHIILRREARRLCSLSQDWDYPTALRHVSDRAKSGILR